MSGFAGMMTTTPSVVQRGLIQHLDASSYTSGSTWNALVGGNATLYASPTKGTSGQNSYMTFTAASKQYATIPNLGGLSNWTIEAWYYLNGSVASTITAIVTSYAGTGDTQPINFCLGQGRATTNYNIAAGYWNSTYSWNNAAGFMPNTGQWYQSVGTYDGSTITQYTNGASINSLSASTLSAANTNPIYIAARWDDLSVTTDYFPGNISIVRIYNRALSATEVATNYTVQRGRHGL
jgi:hypothetical protein